MLDAGLTLYIGLLLIWLWRWLTWWKHRQTQLIYLNYAFLLYMLVLVLTLYAIILFVVAALEGAGKAVWPEMPGWLRPMAVGAPGASGLILLLCGAQMLQHVNEIRRDRAIVKHDRAVQIIALPAVYGAMAMNSLARIFQLTAHQSIALAEVAADGTSAGKNATTGVPAAADKAEAKRELFLSKSETCFWVGDLYEAWALYQFAKLTLELIQASVSRMQRSGNAAERDKANALAVAHSAVEAIAWLGVSLFLVVCVLQAGWSCYLLTFTAPISDWGEYNSRVAQFTSAGMVASAGAIYNVHIVESTFHEYFEDYRPLLKFVTVKVIVSFAFFQKGAFSMLKVLQSTLPVTAQRLSNRAPLLGDILNFSEAEFQLFYDSLMLYECVLICLLHWWGWSAYEDWYLDESVRDEGEEEQRPLLGPRQDGTAAA
eukprot:CAMPEP_0179026632 /NCGR_PEP_ID=MMETSP0796-20121207/8615_1 /TAXON_ID=73915 /ORGANISM="Pyrodinium bahamense, Strain pbaha01" /LENGTH=428 /DNA_ID=CAMNT_0020722719 /DNA_START=62 /DNA_END=1348 /DNA_ORIENTATION=+